MSFNKQPSNGVPSVRTDGQLFIYFGPMFSGKTTKLIRELVTYYDVASKAGINLKVIYINHGADNRKSIDNTASSHHSMFYQLPGGLPALKTLKLSSVDVTNYDIIGIDEAQFFDDLAVTVRDWVINKGKFVLISSLDGNSELNSFGQAHQLTCLSRQVEKMSAKCTNCLDATHPIPSTLAYFTHRISKDTGNIVIGGADKYMAVCLSCYKQLNNTV